MRGLLVASTVMCCLTSSAVVADAATTQCTPLVADARGDEADGLFPGEPYRADLDVLAVDLGTSTHDLVITVKLAGYDPVPAPPRLVDLLFDIGATTYNAYKYVGPEGTIYGFNNPSGGHTVTGTTDANNGTVRIRVPRRLLGVKAGSIIRDVAVDTDELIGINSAAYGSTRDSAESRRTFGLGSRGCL